MDNNNSLFVHLFHASFENFRLFDKKSNFSLPSITILVGPNGSGKSTMIKGLQFISQNAKKKQFPNSLHADFPEIGISTFDHVFSKNRSDNRLSFSLAFVISNIYNQRLLDSIFSGSEIFYHYRADEGENTAILEQVLIKSSVNHDVLIDVKLKNNTFYRVTISPIVYQKLLELLNKWKNNLIWAYELLSRDYNLMFGWDYDIDNLMKNDEVTSKLKKEEIIAVQLLRDVLIYIESHGTISYNESFETTLDLFITEINKSLANYNEHNSFSILSLNSNINLRKKNDFGIATFIIWDYVLSYFSSVKDYLANDFELVDSGRNIVKRYYNYEDRSYFAKKIFSGNFKKEEAVNLLEKLGIATDLNIQIYKGEFRTIKLKQKDGREFDLADLGYGITQLLPIIIDPDSFDPIYGFPRSKFWMISEPESNLHPKLQSQLADIFVHKAGDTYSRFLIETHSEYLIRKLQYLVATGKVEKDEIQIYYFYNPEDCPVGEERVKGININDDGSLTSDFGPGFFDEADRIAMELFLLNNSQKN